MTVSQIQWLEYEYDYVPVKKNDWLTDLSMIDLNMTMTWLWIEYDLTIFQLRLSIGRVHACAISSCKLVFLKLNKTLFWNVLY